MSVQLNQNTTAGATVATLTDGNGDQHQQVIQEFYDGAGGATKVSSANPLPTADAAVLAELVLILAKLSNDPATQTTLAAILTKLNASIAVTGTFWQTTQPVSATTLPLPTGAATDAKQDTGNSSLSTIAAKDFSTETTLAALKSANHTDLAAILAKLISAPATEAKQDTANTSLASIDGKLTSPLSVNVGNFPASTEIANDSGNPVPVSASSLPLPTNAAQETGGNLAGINTNTAKLDILLSALRDAIIGASSKSLTDIDTDLSDLRIAQGATSTSKVGPLVQGIVSDTPNTYLDGEVRPFSFTSEGRLRAAVVTADVDRAWVGTFKKNPYYSKSEKNIWF